MSFIAASKKDGISSQNAKVSKASTETKKKAVAAEPLVEKKENDDDFEKFASSSEGESSADEEAADTYLEGFESTDDEEEDKEESYDAETGLSQDAEVAAKQSKRIEEGKSKAKSSSSSKPSDKKNRGVLYVGRIPHGFYEEQMRAYFGQFGTVTRLRLSRNKKTGQSKHYAFVEFDSAEVAKVVSDTMDNYLLFGHILKVKVMSEDQIRDDLFVGANKKFKPLNWAERNQIANNAPKTRKYWEEAQAKEKEYRQKRSERLKSLGIDYSYESPVAAATTTAGEKKSTPSKPKTKKKTSKKSI